MPPPAQPNPQDNSAALLWGTAAAFAAIGMVWVLFRDQIIVSYLTLKIYELDLLTTLGNFLQFKTETLENLKHIIIAAKNNTEKITFNDLVNLGITVGEWIRVPMVIFLLILGVIVYISNTTRSFKRTYSMRSLANAEKVNWPQITPVVNLDLVKQDIDVGPWAMALTPIQFCKRYRLIEEVRPERREGMLRKEWNKIDVVLRRGEANKIFALQLGPLWRGTEKLPPHVKALFAVFAARINADTNPARELLEQLSRSSAEGKLDASGMNKLLKKYEKSKQVLAVTQAHAYVMTVMASMLETAREDGVQASADFLWLKPVDRKLWYLLNTVGRQTPFIEVAGIFAHWLAEKEAGRALMVPMVENATNAVETALKEIIYRPDEKEE